MEIEEYLVVFGAQRLLETPFYALDQQALFSQVIDFIEFSERNIEWQKRVALSQVEKEMENLGIDEPNRHSLHDHLRDEALFRFDVILPMQTRYSALASLVGIIEWSIRVLHRCAAFDVPASSDNKQSDVIHLVIIFSDRCELDYKSDIRRLELLIWVRNCILHNSGLIEGYRYEAQLREKALQ